ncbi:MAG: glycosyl transferase [Acidobacteria bacterium RIFCSPLOWO2_12_FULL_67_14b]|nr:MAG: glycosyl transferase [Acidobacteria bacterium RIFCSPLOWO2_12_FULL_67_14b]
MTPELSIVIPVHNESPNIKPLYEELTQTLGQYGRSYELLIIDDGSTDDSFEQLAALQARDSRLRVIRFRRNFGQTAAFAAGFAHARGRLVVTSDGDLQNDPRDIPAMVDLLEQGHDIVCGWRKDRKDTFVTRRVPSVLANKLISWATGVSLHDYGCSLKVFRAEVVKPLRLYGEMHRFLPAIASQIGVSIAELVVNHRPRRAGVTKYGLSRTVRVVLDLATVKFLLSYSTRPLQIFGQLGLIAGGLGLAITGWLAYVRLFQHQAIADRPLLLLGVMLVFIGVQLLTFGLLAEVMARTYYESQNKPTYVIREVRETTDLAAAGRG